MYFQVGVAINLEEDLLELEILLQDLKVRAEQEELQVRDVELDEDGRSLDAFMVRIKEEEAKLRLSPQARELLEEEADEDIGKCY